MEMREDRDSRYSCKLCHKKYACGKSLGGHMKSHVIAVANANANANSGELDETFEPNFKKLSSLNAEFGGPSSGYGLRENPKKTWRAVDASDFSLPQEKICKQCGKGFQSLKALCGHMACHSEKDRVFKDDHSWIMDSHSDTEGEDPGRLTRSKSKIYKKVLLKSPSTNYNSYNIGSCSVSEIDEQEQQEEVALCLMMLSRDSSNWGGVNSFVDSSDNNSVVLETKSSSIDMRMIRQDDQKLKIKNICGNKLKSSAAFYSDYTAHLENGYLRNGSKKVDSDISVDELVKNTEYEKKIHDETGKNIKRERGYQNEYKKDFVREKVYNEAAISSSWNWKKRSREEEEEEEESSTKTIKGSSFDVESSKNFGNKKSKYECLNCNRSFNSHQALGGHRPCHKKINIYSPSRHNKGEIKVPNSLIYKKPKSKEFSVNDEKRYKPKKIKGHECPICFRIFKSGQALGGHKRSHFIGGYDPVRDGNNSHTFVTKQDHVHESHDLIDLNLPAPEEEDDDDDEYGCFI